MQASELLEWYNIGFVAVFFFGLVLLGIGLLGLGGDHDVDHDVDHDADGHATSLLDFLGVGRCPLSIVLMIMCFLFTMFGMTMTLTLRMIYVPGLVVGVVAYPVAAVCSFLLTGGAARLLGHFMPTNETYVQSEAHHIGSMGKAVYAFEDGKGFVQVNDASGTLHEIKAASTDTITAGTAVVVIDYDEGTRLFCVQRAPDESTARVA